MLWSQQWESYPIGSSAEDFSNLQRTKVRSVRKHQNMFRPLQTGHFWAFPFIVSMGEIRKPCPSVSPESFTDVWNLGTLMLWNACVWHVYFCLMQISALTTLMKNQSSPMLSLTIITSPRWRHWKWKANVLERWDTPGSLYIKMVSSIPVHYGLYTEAI